VNILFLNCYDPLNPKSGGAEKYTFEIAKRLAKKHNVVWISEKFSNSASEEILENIKILRWGNRLSVLLFAWRYFLKNRNQIDLVVDQHHGYPFLTPIYIGKKRSLTIIYEVAGEIWGYQTSRGISFLGRILERLILSVIYNNRRFITLSSSTKKELEDLGLHNVEIVKPARIKFVQNYGDKDRNLLVSTTGIRKLKRIEDQIMAVNILVRDFSAIKLKITGNYEKDYKKQLDSLINILNLKNNIEFTGFLSEESKNKLVAKAKLSLATSVKEGWGLALSESSALGTPVIAYNVVGYRDSIEDTCGVLTQSNSPEGIALEAKKLLNNDNLYEQYRENCLLRPERTWDEVTVEFEKLIT
jgi:glycosyltransferase involved in cell wall biosynthesis